MFSTIRDGEIMAISRRQQEDYAIIDASRYLSEMKREALTTIVPHPEDIEARIELIGLLRGRRPDMYRLFLAQVEQEGWIALSNGKAPDLQSLDAIRFIQTNATSLDGKRSNQVVEIAKTETNVATRSILDMLKGRK